MPNQKITERATQVPIPSYQEIMLPLLKLANQQGSISLKNAINTIANEFNLTEKEKRELTPTGIQPIIDNRVGWARTYLKKAGLLDYPQRGIIAITDRGRMVLQENPNEINNQFLMRFPEFQQFLMGENTNARIENEQQFNERPNTLGRPETPEEILEKSFLDLKNQLLSEIIEKIKSCSPQFFEKLVVDTLVKMGYGGSRLDAGKAIGQIGDEGIDGIINEDRLGLDVIYIQAKRWDNNVGRPQIQAFVGALAGKRAIKGIFITTSDFTNEAKEYVKTIDTKVILISGKQLAELMWEYGVGVVPSKSYEIKRIDIDYFEE